MNQRRAIRRTGCPINFALEIFGDRWTMLVLRDLLLQNKRRFGEMLASDEAIATNILASRLKRLEAAGIITRTPDPDDKRQVLYRATEKGIALVPTLLEIAAWGAVQDPETDAPEGWAERYHAERDAVVAEHIARLREA